jgi:hypothetical protein
MTASTQNNLSQTPRKNQNSSGTKSSPPQSKSLKATKSNQSSKTSKKVSEELITPDVLLLMSAASVVSQQKGKQQKGKVANNFPLDTDSIPTKESIDILSLLNRSDNVEKLQQSPVKHNSNNQRPSSPPTRDSNNSNANRARSTSNSGANRWAGASYANSPSPNQLPNPALLFQDSSKTNLNSVARTLDFSESSAHPISPPQPSFIHHSPPSVVPTHHFFNNNYSLPPPLTHHSLPHPNFFQSSAVPHSAHQFPQYPIQHQPTAFDASNHLKMMLNIGTN